MWVFFFIGNVGKRKPQLYEDRLDHCGKAVIERPSLNLGLVEGFFLLLKGSFSFPLLIEVNW